jgi:WD40 repeat protein
LAASDGKLRLWETDSGAVPAAPSTLTAGPDARVAAWGISPDGQSALAACDDGTVFQWDLKPGASPRPVALAVPLRATVLAWSPEGHAVLYTKAPPPPEVPGLLCLADLVTGDKRQLEGHEARVTAVAFSPDGVTALSGDEGGTVILWDVPGRTRLKSFKAHDGAITGIAFAPGGGCAVSAGADKTVRLWAFAGALESAALEKRARAARETVARAPADPAALAALVDWYTFRAKDDWAVRLFDRAGGAAPVSHVAMGRCFWRLGDAARANAEFKKALEHGEGPAFYARLCIRATAPAADAISDSSPGPRR